MLETYKSERYQNFAQAIFLTLTVNVDKYDNAVAFKAVFPVLIFQVLFLTLLL